MKKYIFLHFFLSVLLFVASSATAVEFRGTEYDVYIGDINDDGIDDVYLKARGNFVLIHGDISVPLLLDSLFPSYLIQSKATEPNIYLDPVVDEGVNVDALTLATNYASLIDANNDGILDLEISGASSLLYTFSIDGDLWWTP